MIQAASLEITPEMLVLVAAIDEFKGAWRALGTLAPERLSALRRVATIESIGSSTRIEGSRLSDREVERLLSNLEIRSFGSRDEQEVAGYAEIMETVFASWADIPPSENHIKQLHRDLLCYSDKDERHRGGYKTASNSVAAFDTDGKQVGIVFETASPFDTPGRMAELVAWYDEAARLGALQHQMRRLREKVEHERLLLARVPDLSIRLLDHARDHGRISIGDAQPLTGANRNTLKLHFKALREREILVLHGQGRGAWYSLP